MRFLIIVSNRFPIPPERLPELIEAFADWRERYKSFSETFEFFAGGGGGFGIVNVPDEATLHQSMTEYPFAMFQDLDIRAIIDGDQALAMWKEQIKAMAAMLAG